MNGNGNGNGIILDYETFMKSSEEAIELLMNHVEIKRFCDKYPLVKKNSLQLNFKEILKLLLNEIKIKEQNNICIFDIIIIWKTYISTESNRKKIQIILGVQI